MLSFFIRLIIYVIISYALSYFLADDGPEHPSAKPGSIDGTVVTASESVPVLFGTCILNHPNLVWYGHIKTTPWMKCQ